MEENRRESPRYSISLYAEAVEPAPSPLKVQDLSAGGFLIRGNILAGEGGILHARFRVHPSTGDVLVSTRGRVMHMRREGGTSYYGVKIESFDNPEQERAYQSYVSELLQKRVVGV
jgi:PilZ domain.